MPSRYSSDHSIVDAKSLAKNLGIEYNELPIKGIFGAYLKALKPYFAGTAAGAASLAGDG